MIIMYCRTSTDADCFDPKQRLLSEYDRIGAVPDSV